MKTSKIIEMTWHLKNQIRKSTISEIEEVKQINCFLWVLYFNIYGSGWFSLIASCTLVTITQVFAFNKKYFYNGYIMYDHEVW